MHYLLIGIFLFPFAGPQGNQAGQSNFYIPAIPGTQLQTRGFYSPQNVYSQGQHATNKNQRWGTSAQGKQMQYGQPRGQTRQPHNVPQLQRPSVTRQPHNVPQLQRPGVSQQQSVQTATRPITGNVPPNFQARNQARTSTNQVNRSQTGAAVPSQQQALHMQGQEPLTASMLAQAPPEAQKQMLGDRIFPLIHNMYPDLSNKITGMLLEIDNSELLHMLEHQESLRSRAEEAVAVLQAFRAKENLLQTEATSG